jgi:RsiW-degrading membrane proteinase PrsW (M82 family)
MQTATLIGGLVALVPALAFLIALEQLDSFRLVSLKATCTALAAGAVIAVACYFINAQLMDTLSVNVTDYMLFDSAVVEETMKACFVILLFLQRRIAFLVDAAIMGLAVGTGFAMVENVYYLQAFHDAALGLWIVRGFGTAIMHGGATAIFAVLAQSWTERHTRDSALAYIVGLVYAITLHALFNRLLAAPMVATAAVMTLIPMVLFQVFSKSEHRIHDWVTHDRHEHLALLGTMNATYLASPRGRFITDIVARFEGTEAEDILAYMRVHTELVVRAEDLLLARSEGKSAVTTAEDRDRLHNLHTLEKKIGRMAMLALWPHLHFSRQEMAELYELEASLR